MSSILVINAAGRETRVALVENGHIAEFYLERKKDKGIVGNIYKGRVTRVLPGMQAAFVDVGLDKAAFLYVTDVFYDPEFSRQQFELTEGEHDEHEEVPDVDAVDQAQPEEAPPAPSAPMPHEFEMQELPPGELLPPAVAAAPDAIEAPAPTPVAAAAEPVAAEASSEPLPPPSGAEVIAAAMDASFATADGAPPTGAQVVAQALADSGNAAPVAGERRAPRDEKPREARNHEKKQKREEVRVPKKSARIEDLLKVGQEVLVQISKDPIGTKGARLTSHISIPGRHLVFMPTVDHVGISRRIGNEKERRRLREIVDRLRPPGTGFIVRTVAENVPQEKLEADIRFLLEVWNDTIKKNEKRHQPGLMHPDLDLILRATRDLFAQDVEKLIIDDREEYERVLQFVTVQDTALRERVILHDTDEPIFDAYGIEEEIKRATARKVWLKSGGYLIMDQAEALTAIDVNSGRYVGKKSLEETITKINVEAAKEIVYQLRLRNIGGIIICDFIDMEKQQNRDKVFKSLQEALGRDKAKTNVLRISELGLIEMTRKRVRESIGRMLHEDCAYCDGQGFVKTATTVSYEIFRELRRSAGSYKDPTIVISCQAEVAALLLGEEKQELRHLMDRFNKSIQVRTQLDYHREQYDIYARVASGAEHKVASSVEQIEPQRWGNPKRGPSEARLESRGGSDRGGNGGGTEKGGGAQGGAADRGSRRDRDRGRGRQGGGGGGGGANRGGGGGGNARPSQPQAGQQQAAGSSNSEPSSAVAEPDSSDVVK